MDKRLLFLMLAFFVQNTLLAQTDTVSEHQKKETVKPPKKIELVPFPYLSYSSTLGLQYGAGAMVTFKTKKNDTQSPRSTLGSVYVRTTNNSWYSITFSQLYFNEDTWRAIVAFGTGKYNFQTFMEIPGTDQGQFFPYSSYTTMLTASVMRRFYKKNYLGLGYYFNDVRTDFNTLGKQSVLKSSALQLLYLGDTRNNVYYPTKGSAVKATFTMYPEFMGNSKNYGILNMHYNVYRASGKQNVIALRAFAKFGTSALDFQRQVVMGNVDLRGYADGRYRGDAVLDVQGEYRWNFTKKIGAVGFGGLGTLFGSGVSGFNGKIYPSVGVGFRYLAVKSTKMRIGLDVARGKDNFAFYFRLGESF